MTAAVPNIGALELALAFVPIVLVIFIMARWHIEVRGAVFATARMLAQLLLIGYVLVYLFESHSPALIGSVLVVMLVIASWISIRHLEHRTNAILIDAMTAIGGASLPILALIILAVVKAEPWFNPRYVIPLAGMIIASAMNTVSLAAERWHAERSHGATPTEARQTALKASMIPLINSFLAVGLVTLPGMMTGQVLSGVSPLIAAKYQIIVMAMLFGASGLAAIIFLERQTQKPSPTTK